MKNARTACSSAGLLATAIGLVGSCVPLVVGAQTPGPDRLRSQIEAAARRAETGLDCRIAILGSPARDEFSGQWLVMFSAGGNDCDAAIGAFRERAESLGVLLSRRPNRAQITVLASRMSRSVESAYACRFTPGSEPRFEEASGQWIVTYRMSGSDCAAAAAELRSEGEALRVVFFTIPERQGLVR